MKVCNKCGMQNEDTNAFCQNCGNDLNNSSASVLKVNTLPTQGNVDASAAFKKNKSNASIIIALIFFFPLGLYWMWAKSDWNKTAKIIVTVVIALLLVLSAFSGDSDNESVTTTSSETTTVVTKEESTTVTTTEQKTEKTTISTTAAPKATLGELNALETAKQYLDNSGFSKKSLKDQLKYEKYSEKEIDYALENCNADWNEECAESAQSYLDMGGFSKQSLKEQLEYEGFTDKQIEYALKAVGY